MTTAIIIIVAALAGYVVGRAHETGRHAERDMTHWKAHCLAMALTPRIESPVLDLTAEHVA